MLREYLKFDEESMPPKVGDVYAMYSEVDVFVGGEDDDRKDPENYDYEDIFEVFEVKTIGPGFGGEGCFMINDRVQFSPSLHDMGMFRRLVKP